MVAHKAVEVRLQHEGQLQLGLVALLYTIVVATAVISSFATAAIMLSFIPDAAPVAVSPNTVVAEQFDVVPFTAGPVNGDSLSESPQRQTCEAGPGALCAHYVWKNEVWHVDATSNGDAFFALGTDRFAGLHIPALPVPMTIRYYRPHNWPARTAWSMRIRATSGVIYTVDLVGSHNWLTSDWLCIELVDGMSFPNSDGDVEKGAPAQALLLIKVDGDVTSADMDAWMRKFRGDWNALVRSDIESERCAEMRTMSQYYHPRLMLFSE